MKPSDSAVKAAEVDNTVFRCEIWESPGEYIITADSHPIGMTVSESEGKAVCNWLHSRGGWAETTKYFHAKQLTNLRKKEKALEAAQQLLSNPIEERVFYARDNKTVLDRTFLLSGEVVDALRQAIAEAKEEE